MSLIRILGIGSPYGDDDLGWRAIDVLESTHLADRLRPHDVELHRLDRPGPLLIELLSGADLVLILDAMSSGRAPGTLCRVDLSDLETVLTPLSSHGLDLPASLALARSLGMVDASVVIVGIEMGMDSHAQRGSQMPGFAERLVAFIEREIVQVETSAHAGATEPDPGA